MKPAIPLALDDRAADNWRPLLAIAEHAGGEWPKLGAQAALALSGPQTREDDDLQVMVLADIREVFKTEKMESRVLCNRLSELEDRPWPEYSRGRPITPPQLASLLKAFKIAPRTIRTESRTAKGYLLEDFGDAFRRYLGPAA